MKKILIWIMCASLAMSNMFVLPVFAEPTEEGTTMEFGQGDGQDQDGEIGRASCRERV